VAEDVRGFPGDRLLPPSGDNSIDVLTEPVAPPRLGAQWNHCIQEEERRWQARRRRNLEALGLAAVPGTFKPPNSGVRFNAFTLESGESRELDYEVVVPCRYVAVRLHFSVPKPNSISAPESKAVVSLLDACRQSEAIGKAAPPAPTAATRVEFGAAS